MKKIICILTISILAASVPSCKKYEDGPAFSLLTKKARVTGDWSIESVTVNGTDQTAAFKDLLGANAELDIEKDGHYKWTGNFPEKGTWKFGEDKDDLYLQSDQQGAVEESYRILRLKNKELWLRQTSSSGDVTILKLKQ